MKGLLHLALFERPYMGRHFNQKAQDTKNLPREQVIHNIANEDKQCDRDGKELHKLGEDVSETFDFISPKVKVIEHISPNYACREL